MCIYMVDGCAQSATWIPWGVSFIEARQTQDEITLENDLEVGKEALANAGLIGANLLFLLVRLRQTDCSLEVGRY